MTRRALLTVALGFGCMPGASAPPAPPQPSGGEVAKDEAGAKRPSVGDLRKSGTVQLDISCRPEVKEEFMVSLALLHSFFYEEARRRFESIAQRDPSCAMASWGIAMTHYHPLWAPPTQAELTQGLEAAQKAKNIGGKSDVERGLIAAVEAFYQTSDARQAGPVAQSCHGPRDHGARAQAFRGKLEELRSKHPDDLEVTIFYALSLLATAPPTDKEYRNQLAATAILEPLYARHADHPGIAHYIIHAYDYPTLAARALSAARHYGQMAPWVPHALHMPSHIYTRLGMWQDSIESNLASASAAREYTARLYDGAVWYDELHALDYAAFAYLQTAQDEKAEEILAYVARIQKLADPNFAAAYALGAIPARMALERGLWQRAATLQVLHPDVVKRFPFAEAHIEFARAVGAARSGDAAAARSAVARLEALRGKLTDPSLRWWVDQVEIQRLAAEGWTAFAEGKREHAERLLREAALLEDKAGTHPVTPGQLLPAREQLGDLRRLLGRPAEALAEYELSLQAFPNRLNSHLGAARAAEQARQPEIAKRHYRQLLTMAEQGTGRKQELAKARSFLEQN